MNYSQSTKSTYPYFRVPISYSLSKHEIHVSFFRVPIYSYFSLSARNLRILFFRVQSIQTLPLTTVNVRSGVSAVLVVLERSSSAALGAGTVFVVPVSL